MISRLRGTLLTRELDRAEVLTAGGLGYEVFIPRTVFERLPLAGEEVELFTYQVVREDALMLFGFLSQSERVVFGRLLGASGVGPRLAVALLSALPSERLVRAICERDVAALTAVSGVGKKTAERLVLDLTGKFDDVSVAAPPPGSRGAGIQEAVRALTVLGYPTVDAERAVREVANDEGLSNAQELIRAALLRVK